MLHEKRYFVNQVCYKIGDIISKPCKLEGRGVDMKVTQRQFSGLYNKVFYRQNKTITGSLVQGYDSRLGCERSRVQIPDEPTKYFEKVLKARLLWHRQFQELCVSQCLPSCRPPPISLQVSIATHTVNKKSHATAPSRKSFHCNCYQRLIFVQIKHLIIHQGPMV